MRSSVAALAVARAVQLDRLWQRLMALAEIGARAEGGVARHAFSPEDIQARAQVIEWAEASGLEVRVDAIANLWVRRPGRNPSAPPVISGSHLDSQPSGGRFDGVLGVLGALEVLTALQDCGIETERPIEMVAWSNEEGGRFERGSTGSSVWAGALALEDCLHDLGLDGVRLSDALALTLAATPALQRRALGGPARAYVELHIEQGPVLEMAQCDIGAVTSIQGGRWLTVEIEGQAGHAGTTPPSARLDALQAAHRAIAVLNGLMQDHGEEQRFTIGRFDVQPNAASTIAGKVAFTIDFRHPRREVLEEKTALIGKVIATAAAPCRSRVQLTSASDPIAFDETLVALVEKTAKDQGFSVRRLPSGAFHDAYYAAAVCPTAMVFVPCRRGLSHNPDEYVSPAACAAGARVLAAALVSLAND